MWLIATVAVVTMLWHGVRETDSYFAVRNALHAAYVVALLWYLCRSGPSLSHLQEFRRSRFQNWKYGRWIPVLAVSLVLLLTMISDDGVDILMLLMMVSTVAALVAWRREIRLRAVIRGLGVALIACLGGLPFLYNDFIGETAFYLLLILTPPMYVAGGLLFERTRLGGIRLLAGQYQQALKSFLLGCLLFVPHGMINAAAGSPGSNPTWVSEWWMPLSLPWFSGIAEETWFRLLLVGLCFFLIWPAFHKHPALAVIIVVLFSGITFGLGHDRTMERFLTTGLLYGVPMAAVFARRDFEYAVGAHYMVNFIPWVMVFLENETR